MIAKDEKDLYKIEKIRYDIYRMLQNDRSEKKGCYDVGEDSL